jgi:hypothetical protein
MTKPVLTEKICTDCGQIAMPVSQKRGNDEIEINLWLLMAGAAVLYVFTGTLHTFVGWLLHFYYFPPGTIVRLLRRLAEIFFVLGLVYTIWRLSTTYQACSKCQHETVIPLDSPKGQKVQAEHQKPAE